MKELKSKLTLEKLKVQSFITEFKNNTANTVNGGDSRLGCKTMAAICATDDPDRQ